MNSDPVASRWVAASYHLPMTYSCRLPMSSATSAPTSPGPGPATVRLALIRTSIEVFGLEETRQWLFPTVCTLPIRIRPPASVAISPQVLRSYKMVREAWGTQITETLVLREMAHANDPLTIYLQVPEQDLERWFQVLSAIGYWGQTSSLAWCLQITHEDPSPQECVLPFRQWENTFPVRSYYSCILADFQEKPWTWQDFLPEEGSATRTFLRLEVYIWPMVLATQHGNGKLLIRSPFPISSLRS